MDCRLRWPPLGLLMLAGCAREARTPDGAFLLDEDFALVRGAQVDSAQREIAVDGDSVVVAVVDENLTDVSGRLRRWSVRKCGGSSVQNPMEQASASANG